MPQEQRNVSGFDEVRLEGVGTIYIEQGNQESLTIEAPEHLLSKIKSDLNAGRLELGFRHWYDYLVEIGHAEIIYRLTVIRLRGVAISGAARLQAGPLETDRFRFSVSGSGEINSPSIHTSDLEVRISGSGKTQIGGSADRVDVEISGSGDLRGDNLQAQDVRVRISGTGKIEIHAEKRLDVRISGSGEVRYSGSPDVTQSISGVGSVRRV